MNTELDAELAERMAQRAVLYITSFDEHASAIRGKDQEEIANAYDEVAKNAATVLPRKSLSDGELASWEQSLHIPAHTTYDHVRISLAAHSLMLSNINEIGSLSPDMANKIHARITELRSQRKPKREDLPSTNTRFRPLVPPPPLPELTRPTAPVLAPLNEGLVQTMLASPSGLIGKLFFLEDSDFYYRVVGIKWSMDASCIFQLQYDGALYADDVSESEMKGMLMDSAAVDV